MKVPINRVLVLVLSFLNVLTLYGQTVTFGPGSPAANANTVTTCSGSSNFNVQFSNSSTTLSNVRIDIQLNEGISYVPQSFTFTSSGSAAVVEGILSDLNRPQFKIESLDAGEQITLTIGRVGSCTARSLKINGSTFSDSTFIYQGITEVNYSNGVGAGVATYDVIYASLSIVNVSTTPNPINIAGTATRSMEITNGSFGSIDSFTFVEVYPTNALTFTNFVINPAGINYSIPVSNIDTSGDSLIIAFSPSDINYIDGSGGSSGNGDASFDLDEQFILQYEATATSCGVGNNINSDLSAFWGCENTICQTGTNSASIGLVNATPTLTVSKVLKPTIDICQTVNFSMTLTNTSIETTPAGGSFAKDVVVFLGLRQNKDAIATLANVTMTSPEYYGRQVFSNYKINGIAVALDTIRGKNDSLVYYIAPDYYDTDPDGVGGLEDLDGDGYFDDLAKDSNIVVSFDVALDMYEKSCGLGRTDYLRWEHISSDINWSNQCGTLMTPVREEFMYKNMIRDYHNTTLFESPTDLVDNEKFTASIQPYLYNGLACNGGSGTTGADVEWIVRAILPPGIIVDPDYDPLDFSVSGDTIFTTGKYIYEYTDFPLLSDCSSWNNINPVPITFQTIYNCNSGGSNCFTEEIHCADVPIYMHCGTSCTGVTPLSFSTLRTSGSWTSSNQDNLIDITDPGIEREIVYPGDTIEFAAAGVFSDTMSDNLYLRINYTLADTFNLFNFVNGTVTIKDIDGEYNGGQFDYTLALNGAPTINHLGLGEFEMLYDLSSYTTNIDANYLYGKSILGAPNYDADSVSISAFFTLGGTMTDETLHDVENFRSYFYIMNSGSEISCSSWGSTLAYQEVDIRTSVWDNFVDGCNTVRQNFYLTHASNSSDDHPNEYRPVIHWDSATIDIPVGFVVDDVYFLDNVKMSTSDYTFINNELRVYRPSYYTDDDKRSTYFPRLGVDLTPTCASEEGINNFDLTYFYKERAYLTDRNQQISTSISSTDGFIDYTKPSFSLVPNEATKEILGDQTSWIVNLCSSTSSSDIDYNWIILDAPTAGITVDSVHDLRTGSPIIKPLTTRGDGSVYFELDSLDIGSCVPFEIFGKLNSCGNEILNINHGWGCGGYMLAEDAVTCSAVTTVSVKNKNPQLSTNVTTLTNTPSDPSSPTSGNWNSTGVDMCVPFPAEIKIVNAQPGNLYNTSVQLKIPSSGMGLEYEPGSMTIEVEGVDAVNVPRSIGATAEANLVAASNGSLANWVVALSELDPTNFGSDEPLFGTDNISQNEITLRWLTKTTCDLSSGDQFTASVSGEDFCGGAAEGSGENIQGFPIDINGVVPTYLTSVNSSISPDANYEGCNDLKTININLFVSGGSTQSSDTLVVNLPAGLGYADGFVCNTPGKCPTFVSATLIGGQEEIRFAYTNGISGAIDLDFDLASTNRGSCGLNEIVNIKSENTLPGISCGAGTCPAVKAITGSNTFNINISKPELDVSFLNVQYTGTTSNPNVSYDLELSNSGLATEQNVIVDFYCLNAAGDDIMGASVAKDTLTSILTNGGNAQLTNSFDCNCDPNQGIVVMVTPEYENCYCSALDSLNQKSPGLAEIPHDKISSITLPVEISSFTTKNNDCDILLQWTTVSESNADYFIIERGFDGINFLPVAEVTANGNSSIAINYEYKDQGRNSSDVIYYRLKQIDFDGSIHQIETKAHHRTTCTKLENELVIQPNFIHPSSSNSTIIFYNNNGHQNADLQIFSLTGQLVREQSGIALNIDRNDILAGLEDLQGGSYQVVLHLEKGKFYTGRFVVVE